MQSLTFLENVKAYVGFDDDASAALRGAHPLVAPHFGAIIDDFYATRMARDTSGLTRAETASRQRC